MMEKKKMNTVQDVEELEEWFLANDDRIPAAMQINPCAYTKDVKTTVKRLLEQAYVCCENPKMQGCMNLLNQIKRNVEEG